MRKCLPLNLLEPTRTKSRILRETYGSYLGIVRETLSCLDGVKSRGQLHSKTYRMLRDGHHRLASEFVIEATSHA